MKHLTFRASALLALGAMELMAGDTTWRESFTQGKVSGQIREFSVARSVLLSAGNNYTRTANAIGGHLKYETAPFYGLQMGVAFHTSNGFGLDSNLSDPKKVDMTLLGVNNANVAMVSEAYIAYKRGNTAFKGGRQALNTPMAGGDDARMIANFFEAYTLSNTDIDKTTLSIGHITRFAQGTFGRVYDASANAANAILSATSGYSLVDSRNQATQFVDAGKYATGTMSAGITMASATYNGIENTTLQLWDYLAYDIMNTVYAQADYKLPIGSHTLFASAQAIKQNSIGAQNMRVIGGDGTQDSIYVAALAGGSVAGFTLTGAYSQTTANAASESSYTNAIITPWGGMPAFTQGMVTRHMFLAGTKAYKAALAHNAKPLGLDIASTLYYTYFDMADNNGYTYGDASEFGFDFIYNTAWAQGLQIRVRGNFPRSFNVTSGSATTGWDEYRLILNYTF